MTCKLDQRPRDARGYIIPWVVWRDKAGRPHFTINDEILRAHALAQDLCAICGGKLWRGRWCVGGAGSAFHARGMYIDTPMHDECAHYALRTCPYLAAPNYSKRIDGKLVPAGDAPILMDPTMDPVRPPLFVAVLARGHRVLRASQFQSYVIPKRPYIRVEYWREGKQITEAEAEPFVKAELARLEAAHGQRPEA